MLTLGVLVFGATAFWVRDTFVQPLEPADDVALTRAAAQVARRAAAPTAPLLSPEDARLMPSIPEASVRVRTTTTTTQPAAAADPMQMSREELEALLNEYRAHYRERFRTPARDAEVSIQYRTGRSMDVRFRSVEGDSIRVLLNGATLTLPRAELSARSRAMFYEDDYAEYMARRRLNQR